MDIILKQLTMSDIEDMERQFSLEENKDSKSNNYYLEWISKIESRMLSHMKFVVEKGSKEDEKSIPDLEFRMRCLTLRIRNHYINNLNTEESNEN